ncbi:FlaG protein [Marinospirillum celere]|uniref:FlaG protein n=1 Tax=Marinospirillum celere TaxID=1122252 RepID=A0A1I1GZG1_9GAMM|nr:flagellar protein FlaG [Marinospirillum celere]SFC14330.1 FlaG protein [Marinospirillum celere]
MASEMTTQAVSGFNESLSFRAQSGNQQPGSDKAQVLKEAQKTVTTEQASELPTTLKVEEKIAEQLNRVEQMQEDASKEFSMDELQEVLNEINSAFYLQNRAVKFEIHDKTEDLVVQVLNTKTDEVIRQYPSEEILNRRKRLMEGDTNFFSTRVY